MYRVSDNNTTMNNGITFINEITFRSCMACIQSYLHMKEKQGVS